VPIQVNKNLVHSDGMRVIDSGKVSIQFPGFDGRLLTEMDKYVSEILCIIRQCDLSVSLVLCIIKDIS
jgi:hypothetical protein